MNVAITTTPHKRVSMSKDEEIKELQTSLDVAKQALFLLMTKNIWLEEKLKRYEEKYGEL